MQARQITVVLALLFLGACLVLVGRSSGSAAFGEEAGLKARVFEMRTYTTAPGRLEDLHSRFRKHTNYLFVKHGMTLIGYWTPVDAEERANTLVYLLAYPSREAREASWKAFLDDPEWKRVFAESHRDGVIVTKVASKFFEPTDYSPIR